MAKKYTILMMGAKRTGKSSMLASMIESMGRLDAQTGIKFEAADETKEKIDSKLGKMRDLFTDHRGEEEFTTIDSARQTAEITSYDFQMKLGKNKNDVLDLQFIDIPGEVICQTIIENHIKNCSCLLVAIDTPALMEEKRDGIGLGHNYINITDDRLHMFMQNHFLDVADGQKAEKKMILFVPIKCERYYHDERMEEVADTIRAAYKNTFAYLKNNDNVAAAVTPVLTLGNIVFKRYAETRRNNPLRTRYINTETPCYFEFRNEDAQYDPKFCEQPLVYICAYLMSVTDHIQQQTKGLSWNAAAKYIVAAMFGWGAILAVLVYTLFTKHKQKLQNLCSNVMKTSGDGYRIIHDPNGLFQVSSSTALVTN